MAWDTQTKVKGYGVVEFGPMNPSGNYYELYDVAIVDPETNQITDEEHYISESDYHTALCDVYGREVLEQQKAFGECEVESNWGECYVCECDHNVAYVIDHEE